MLMIGVGLALGAPPEQATGGLARMVAAILCAGCRVVIVVATKSRDLDDFAAEAHMDDTKAAPDDAGIAKQGVDVFRGCIGCHIEILGVAAQ